MKKLRIFIFLALLPATLLAKHDFHQPPDESTIPNDEFGKIVRKGKAIFEDTHTLAKEYVGKKNQMNCKNCHLNSGTKPFSAPMWGAFGMYPKYRKKNGQVNSFEERIQGCFMYSMNGKKPPQNSEVLTALNAYAFWLAQDVPLGKKMKGAGYKRLNPAEKKPDYKRGKQVYQGKCLACHGVEGAGMSVSGKTIFPPLWGEGSYNWGAGMHQLDKASAFIKANMPLAQDNTLTDQEAWDVAFFINSQKRPEDPRKAKAGKDTAKLYHQHQCNYEK